MSKMIQIRNVPDALHRTLRNRAALAGMSLSDYLQQELELMADTLTYDELEARLAALPTTVFQESAADIIRRQRDDR